jgi:hypothetical protein
MHCWTSAAHTDLPHGLQKLCLVGCLTTMAPSPPPSGERTLQTQPRKQHALAGKHRASRNLEKDASMGRAETHRQCVEQLACAGCGEGKRKRGREERRAQGRWITRSRWITGNCRTRRRNRPLLLFARRQCRPPVASCGSGEQLSRAVAGELNRGGFSLVKLQLASELKRAANYVNSNETLWF